MRKILAALALCGTLGLVMAIAAPAYAGKVVLQLGDRDHGHRHGHGSFQRHHSAMNYNRHRHNHYY